MCVLVLVCAYLCRHREIRVYGEPKVSDYGRCRHKLPQMSMRVIIIIGAQRLGDLMIMACDFVPLRFSPLSQIQMFNVSDTGPHTRKCICVLRWCRWKVDVQLRVVSIQKVLCNVLLEKLRYWCNVDVEEYWSENRPLRYSSPDDTAL